MSTVVNLRPYVDQSAVPTLVLIDMQQEYIASPRALALPGAAGALANCRAARAHAQAMGFPIAFVRWFGRSPFFNAATMFARWIDGFEPANVEMVFERSKPSCYVSAQFAEVMSVSGGNLVLAGFAGEAACLSTAIDAFHHNHRFTFLADASASHNLDDMSAAEVHHAVSRVIGLYGEVMDTREWIRFTSSCRKTSGGENEKRSEPAS